jgi:hypothetical protein
MGLSAQEILKTDPEFVQRQLQAQEMQRLNPSGSAAGAIGAVLGRGLGNVSRGQGFFETNNPGLQRVADVNNIMKSVQFDPKNPATYYEQVGTALQEAGYADLAPMAFQEARKFAPKDKFVTGKPGEKIYRQTSTGELEEVASIPDRESIVKTPANFAAAAGELGFGVLPNLSDYTPAQTAAVNNLLQTRGERTQAAGVPGSGEVKVSDIKGAQDIVATYTKAPQDRLSTVRQLRVSLGEAKQGTGAALPQLRRDLVKLVGDNQIGQGEVQQALGSIGIVGDAISGINQLFTGVPSAEKLKDVEKFITALETEHAQSYNRGRETANKVLSEAKLSPETVKTLIPPEYKTGREKKTSNFVEGKIYKDASGNRARYVNGKWEPVQ